jgi:hypothetical protein
MMEATVDFFSPSFADASTGAGRDERRTFDLGGLTDLDGTSDPLYVPEKPTLA